MPMPMPNPPMLPIIGAAYEVIGAAVVTGAETEVCTGAVTEPVATGAAATGAEYCGIGICIGICIGIGAGIGAAIGIGAGICAGIDIGIGAGIDIDIDGAIIGAPMVGATKLPGCAIGADMPNPPYPPIAGWAYPPYPP